MRTIDRTGQFKRDYKRETKGPHRATLDADLLEVVALLADDQPLPERNHDHMLVGEWKDVRDCRVKPDLIRSIGSQTQNGSNWCASARMASLACEVVLLDGKGGESDLVAGSKAAWEARRNA